MEHLGYLFAAYSAIFIAIFLYVLFIGRRQASLEEELKALEARLETLNQRAPESEPASEH
jgi:CcmD family protein